MKKITIPIEVWKIDFEQEGNFDEIDITVSFDIKSGELEYLSHVGLTNLPISLVEHHVNTDTDFYEDVYNCAWMEKHGQMEWESEFNYY